jgi:myo-inositol-1(or 4)-monophosphatase
MMGAATMSSEPLVPHDTLLAVATTAAKAAGALLCDYARSGFRIVYKNPINLVTDADHAAEQSVIEHIRKQFPDHGLIAEERGAVPHPSSRYRWIIDPLDGTTNFAHGFPFYCVSVGVECDGVPIVGVVYDPSREELFTASLGGGARVNGTQIEVSSTETLDRALLVTGFAYDIRETPNNNLDHFSRFALSAQGMRRTGSAALDLCYVAAGRFDGFWEIKLNPWDMAAGVVILREAGGTVTDFSGKAHSIHQPQLVASNGRIHEAMLTVLQGGSSR